MIEIYWIRRRLAIGHADCAKNREAMEMDMPTNSKRRIVPFASSAILAVSHTFPQPTFICAVVQRPAFQQSARNQTAKRKKRKTQNHHHRARAD